jgi:hypothetical protein
VRYFWATPQAAIGWRSLQGCCQFFLLLVRQQRPTHINLMAPIAYPRCSLRIPPSNHPTNPSRCVAKLLSSHVWRFALLRQPQNMPMRSFHRIFRLPIPFMQFFCCVFGLDFDSLSHTS